LASFDFLRFSDPELRDLSNLWYCNLIMAQLNLKKIIMTSFC